MDPGAQPLRDIARPGIKATGDLLRELRSEVAKLLGRSSYGFPGAQPVSFARQHLEELRKEEWVLRRLLGLRWPFPTDRP